LQHIAAVVKQTCCIKTRHLHFLDLALPPHCLLRVVQGMGGLWRGVAPAMLRAVPVNAAIFLAVEGTRKFVADTDERVDALVVKVQAAQQAATA
jgi:hypothetical protein